MMSGNPSRRLRWGCVARKPLMASVTTLPGSLMSFLLLLLLPADMLLALLKNDRCECDVANALAAGVCCRCQLL